MKCFWKAHCVGDIEVGIALLKLANLYEKTNEPDQAAAAYSQVPLLLNPRERCSFFPIYRCSLFPGTIASDSQLLLQLNPT